MKHLVILCFFLANCVERIPPDENGNVVGRIVRKVQFSPRFHVGDMRSALVLSNGTESKQGDLSEHYCYVSAEEYARHHVGEIYTCSYKKEHQ